MTLVEAKKHSLIKEDDDDNVIKCKVLAFINEVFKHEGQWTLKDTYIINSLSIYIVRNYNDAIDRVEINLPLRLLKES